MPLEVNMTDEQQVVISVSPVTATGKPATLDGPITVTVSAGDGTVVQDPATPNSATLVSGGLGDTTYVVSGDADLGAGVQTISDTATIHVAGALATSLGLTAGTPSPKP